MTDDFLTKRGVDPEIWEARGCLPYRRGGAWVKEWFRPHLQNPVPGTKDSRYKIGTVTKWVNQCTCKDRDEPGYVCPGTCGGWLLVKHSPPGYPPVPPQLRPDEPISANERVQWHKHDGIWSPWPDFTAEAGEKRAGKPLPRRVQVKKGPDKGEWVRAEMRSVLYGPPAEAHIHRGLDSEGKPKEGAKPYDPETGEGYHMGVNVKGVHRHAPDKGKYQLLGKAARIDLHPLALGLLAEAETVFFVLEGTLKNDSVLSGIRRERRRCSVFSVPSVSMWEPGELERFANEHLQGKVVLVVPDADWHQNHLVEWQALKIRTLLRRWGVDSYIAAPPVEEDCEPDDYWKGIDDFRGSGHKLGELMLDGREPPPEDRLDRAVWNLPHQYRRPARDALLWLSLCENKRGVIRLGFQTLKKRLGYDGHADRLVPVLQALERVGAITIKRGSLHTMQKPIPGRKGWTQTMWEQKPTITLDGAYRANRERSGLLAEDFWQRTAVELLRAEVDDLKSWRREQESRNEAA